MLSAILVLALISSNCVKSQMSGSPPTDPDYDYESTPSNYIVYDDETTTAVPFDDDFYNDKAIPFPYKNLTFETIPPELLKNLAEQKGESDGSGGGDGYLWLYVCIMIIASIGLMLFGVYIVYDLSKLDRRKTEERERYIAEKHRELDHVAMSSSSQTDRSSAPIQPEESPSKSSRSAESVRSPIPSGKKDSNALSIESKPKVSSANEPSKKTLSSV